MPRWWTPGPPRFAEEFGLAISSGVQMAYMWMWWGVAAQYGRIIPRTGIRLLRRLGLQNPEAFRFGHGALPAAYAKLLVDAVRECLHRWRCDGQPRCHLPVAEVLR